MLTRSDEHADGRSVTLTVMGPLAEGAGARPDLDRWLSAPALRTSHRRETHVGADVLWRAAATVRLRDCRLLGRLVGVRVPGSDPAMTFEELFRTQPFVYLDGGPTWALSGLCGRIWTVRGELGELSGPQAFLEWQEPATVRVLFAHWVVESRGGGAALHSEVRIAPVDRRAAFYLRALEPFIAAFQGLVGVEPLSAAVRRAGQL
jgi:hypothetical protein